jgi:magnesium transporter
MDAIVDQYFPVVAELGEELEVLEEDVFNGRPNRETISNIYQLKRDLLGVKRAISPVIDICNRLMRFDTQLIPEETRPYFRDIYDHTIRINEMVDSTRELLTSVLEVNFSFISISQNDVSKKFAGWAAILGVPTMVAGIYGMNFAFMPELSWHFGYPFVLGLTVFVCIFLYWRFKRSGWL